MPRQLFPRHRRSLAGLTQGSADAMSADPCLYRSVVVVGQPAHGVVGVNGAALPQNGVAKRDLRMVQAVAVVVHLQKHAGGRDLVADEGKIFAAAAPLAQGAGSLAQQLGGVLRYAARQRLIHQHTGAGVVKLHLNGAPQSGADALGDLGNAGLDLLCYLAGGVCGADGAPHYFISITPASICALPTIPPRRPSMR